MHTSFLLACLVATVVASPLSWSIYSEFPSDVPSSASYWGSYGCYEQVSLFQDALPTSHSVELETSSSQKLVIVSALDHTSPKPSSVLRIENLEGISSVSIPDEEVMVLVFEEYDASDSQQLQTLLVDLCAQSAFPGPCEDTVPAMKDHFIWHFPREHVTGTREHSHKLFQRISSELTSRGGEADPIPALLAQVSEESQRNFLYSLTSVHTRLSTAGTVTLQASYYLSGLLQGFGLDPFMYYFDPDFPPNVCADITGSLEPETLVIVGAHYDDRMKNILNATARAPGANDDGSGCSLLQEVAKIMSSSGYQFKYTTRFCFWGGEEQGLVGSSAYAAALRANDTNIVAMLQADMIGYLEPGKDYQVDMAIRETDLQLTEMLNEITALYVPSIIIGNTTSCCTDSESFNSEGYSAAAYNEPGGYTIDPQYHSTLDVVDRPGYNLTLIGLITQSVLAGTLILAEIL